mmetsp:Transcript_9766/g.19825  ORF Transcript_9766/g.19825 Transcript_9766/m.19825 type:complete len:774 (-) Transcript_9766:7-2328(-)
MTNYKLSSFLNLSCASTVLMALYIAMAGFNIYRLMHPLSGVDLNEFESNTFVKPLWTAQEETMHMRVYLSSKKDFTLNFLEAEFGKDGGEATKPSNVAILWDEEVSSPSFSKSFLLTSLECLETDSCPNSSNPSHEFAVSWLDQAEKIALERGEGGVIAAMSAAGQGIESTSMLLTAYQSLNKQIKKLLAGMGVIPAPDEEKELDLAGILDRKIVSLPPKSPIWKAIQSNQNIYVHVLLLRQIKGSELKWPPSNLEEATAAVRKAFQSHAALKGNVNMVKAETPHHIGKPRRHLYRDIVYFWNKYVKQSSETPPWDMAESKPEEYKNYKQMVSMKEKGQKYPYWKPEVAVKYINDPEPYPMDLAQLSGMPVARMKPSKEHPTGYAFTPAIHVDEIGLTQEKYIPLNETVTNLPLRISFDRSDMEHMGSRSTATAGGLSPARWRLLTHLSSSLEAQKELGFEQSDIDDVRRLIADTNVALLAITMLASALHLLFEFLTFRSEVSFWQKNDDLTGLSVQALFLDLFGQTIILLYLIEKESSLLMTVPSAIGCLIALWKCQRASGLKFMKSRTEGPVAWYNHLPRLVGYELRATRLEIAPSSTTANGDKNGETKKDLTALTIESDRLATRTLGVALLPLVIGYTFYSLIFEEHVGWVSWAVSSAASAVYALGFVMMTPQLFLNWKLKSVAHLPWRVLIYKSLNTFIDDLFSFIIRMPTMARISCFRDDIVFFIYLYQRWLYPVDTSRPVEGGDGAEEAPTSTTTTIAAAAAEKKNQ